MRNRREAIKRVPWPYVTMKALFYATAASGLHLLGVYTQLYGWLLGTGLDTPIEIAAPFYFVVALACMAFWHSGDGVMIR